ncbi:GFA family protein [Aspergillus fijiensis CBS 313.89]|uniref:CENP-V/GFA domain-containing protein n=1 Tax=Aspergillus fijiensis CBS 313.89 TaxID=1448319 RepID=A0A8G1VYV5_9EURO|nr:uncharacterized protein BO72DRAFT_447210 [Aspergillus fijiensis CBS 313.89]RAK78135.1 hypothetical protein BO72DRAFT_447210 [Aspergillus fijiensis CBS 313.89]
MSTSTPSTSHTGTCLCRAIHFTVTGPPTAVYCCYCRDCSLGAGGPCQITARYPRSQFALDNTQGQLRTYAITETASGAPKHKYFCGRCGCTVYTVPRATEGGGIVVVRPALIPNGLEIFRPQIECFTRHRPGWFAGCEAVGERFEGSSRG